MVVAFVLAIIYSVASGDRVKRQLYDTMIKADLVEEIVLDVEAP